MTVHQPLRTGPQPPYQAPPPYPAYHNPQGGAHSLANYAPPPLPPGPEAAPAKLFTPYVAVWSALGGVAALCLGYAILTGEPATQLSADDPRFASQIASDLSGLKDSVSEVRMELSKLKTDLAGQDAQGRILSAQLMALERKVAAPAAGSESGIQADARPAPELDEPVKAKSPDTEAATGTTATPQRPRLVNGDGSLNLDAAVLETGSVVNTAKPAAKAAAKAATKPDAQAAAPAAADAVDFSKIVVKPEAKPVGVQISSGASVDSLRLSWSLLSDRHSEALKNLEPRFVARGDEAAPTFDLIAGPIKSRSDAQKVCKALAAKGVPCKVGDYLGEAL